ncbi:MAG: transcription termination/antitermination factor NusG [Clostridia bacterium]|nr:transcription termination/antitermination factor NusG [Clostridiales bacterium]MBR1971759.1 transcription termination/antitermination factor NusG [Clostridia bacterium]MBR2324368.1 transcription termination/antitermination factor NusG [Clostridia bacterium]MBR2398019.1 transcription termination/antitermination factor NusG [Clostridia bacterium]MBR2496556.1 transcription termination/antitermination factor NusG [Clostridia bacterium]
MAEMTEAKWYVLHTYSGYEAMVKDSLEKLIEINNLQEYIFDIQVPMEQTVEEKANGKKKIVMRKLIPCYVFVKIAYTNDLWFLITQTRGVTGFVGPGGRPLPLTDEEVKRMHLEKTRVEDVKVKVGDEIKVIEGALEGFAGVVVEVNQSQNKVRTRVSMFGRDTEVDLDFTQIEVIEKF